MDALSIVRSAVSIAAACRSLYIFFAKVQDGDPIVIGVRKEIEGMENTVRSVRSIADSQITNGLHASEWRNVHRILNDSEDCILQLSVSLGKPDSSQEATVLKRIWRQWAVELKRDQLVTYQN